MNNEMDDKRWQWVYCHDFTSERSYESFSRQPLKRCYPRWNTFLWNMADVGLMMDSEKEILETVEAKTPMTNYWIPLTWATNIINRARREKLISNDHMVQTILLEMSDIRYRLGSLIGYDNVNIPILYSQVGIAFTLFTDIPVTRWFCMHIFCSTIFYICCI